jgi:hypothetical protein
LRLAAGAPSPADATTRFFGQGDVFKNAELTVSDVVDDELNAPSLEITEPGQGSVNDKVKVERDRRKTFPRVRYGHRRRG